MSRLRLLHEARINCRISLLTKKDAEPTKDEMYYAVSEYMMQCCLDLYCEQRDVDERSFEESCGMSTDNYVMYDEDFDLYLSDIPQDYL